LNFVADALRGLSKSFMTETSDINSKGKSDCLKSAPKEADDLNFLVPLDKIIVDRFLLGEEKKPGHEGREQLK
jgi:hypothetical protein